jgi:hypothetical protein
MAENVDTTTTETIKLNGTNFFQKCFLGIFKYFSAVLGYPICFYATVGAPAHGLQPQNAATGIFPLVFIHFIWTRRTQLTPVADTRHKSSLRTSCGPHISLSPFLQSTSSSRRHTS